MLLLFMSTIYVIVLANVLDASMGLTNVEAREPLYQGGGYFGGALFGSTSEDKIKTFASAVPKATI